MRRVVLLACASLLLNGAVLAQTPPRLTAAERTGRSIFQTRCAMCHVGGEPAAEMQNPAAERRPATMGPLLSQANTADEAGLRTKIRDGSLLMPGYKHALSAAQIDQVVAFMKTIDKPLTRLYLARPGE